MWAFLLCLVQAHSDTSSKRVLLLLFLSVVTVMWVIMSFKAGRLVEIPWGPVTIIGALITGVASDHFGNNPNSPSIPSGDVNVTVNKKE